MKIKLTPELKRTLELRHSKVRDVRECDRIKAVLLSIFNDFGYMRKIKVK